MDTFRCSSSGSKSITALPSSGRPSRVVAPAVNSIASASWLFPAPPCPTNATVRRRPISSTAIRGYLSWKNSSESGHGPRPACGLRSSHIVHLVESVVRALDTHVARQHSAHDVFHFEEQCTLRVDPAHQAGLALGAVGYRYPSPRQRREALPLGAD